MRTLGDNVVQALRTAILARWYPGGAKLSDAELAEQLNVSRGTVRDALRHLTHEGLVINRPNRGYFVNQLDTTEVLDLLEMRALLEGRAAASAVQDLTDEDFTRLTEISDLLGSLDYAEEIERIRDLDIEFHNIVAGRCERPILLELWSSLNSRLYLLDVLCVSILEITPDNCADRHRDYVNELRSRDPERARAAGTRHYLYHRDRFRAWLDEHARDLSVGSGRWEAELMND